MLPIYIINILKDYSDELHPLLIQKIIYLMQELYNETFERKAVSRCIKELIDMDYDIEYCKGYYLQERSLNRNEIKFLSDQVLSTDYLTKKQKKQLLNKLLIDESYYFKRSISHIHSLNELPQGKNFDFFLTIEILSEAIEANKKAAFDYMEYGFDRQLHKRREEKYIVNPYDILAVNGKYYVVANYDKYDNLANFRIDKIKNVEILKESRKPFFKVGGESYSYPKYKMEHIYMFSGKIVHAKIRFKNFILNQIFDWFGLECNIQKENNETSILTINVNEKALYFWLKQYDDYVERIE